MESADNFYHFREPSDLQFGPSESQESRSSIWTVPKFSSATATMKFAEERKADSRKASPMGNVMFLQPLPCSIQLMSFPSTQVISLRPSTPVAFHGTWTTTPFGTKYGSIARVPTKWKAITFKHDGK